jgi:DNA-binding transcriptional regulator YiaG
MPEITADQSRAARALLHMSEEDLAAAANVGLATLRAFEAGLHLPTSNSLRSIRLALEHGGIELTADVNPTVRLAVRGARA